MGRNNMEREFRQKLEAREIEPSANSWDRLDAMLSVAEEKKEKPVFKLNWLYIAAGFIGILLMATIFFKQSQRQFQPENAIVIESEKSPAHKEDHPAKTGEPILDSETPVSNESVAETEAEQKPANNSNNKILAPKQETEFKHTNDAIAQSNQIAPSVQMQKPTIKSPEVNVDELLASVDSKKADIQRPSIKVDAGSLLSQVDGEIELSFREKVIRTVSKNYKNVKVALANRNQE